MDISNKDPRLKRVNQRFNQWKYCRDKDRFRSIY